MTGIASTNHNTPPVTWLQRVDPYSQLQLREGPAARPETPAWVQTLARDLGQQALVSGRNSPEVALHPVLAASAILCLGFGGLMVHTYVLDFITPSTTVKKPVYGQNGAPFMVNGKPASTLCNTDHAVKFLGRHYPQSERCILIVAPD